MSQAYGCTRTPRTWREVRFFRVTTTGSVPHGKPADGILYETLAVSPDGGTYACRRSLIEIKTPWKLRQRPTGGEFYPYSRQSNGRRVRIPSYYYDRVWPFQRCCDRIGWRNGHGFRFRVICRFEGFLLRGGEGGGMVLVHGGRHSQERKPPGPR